MSDTGGEKVGHPLFELTRARVFEFWREPGALFWVFIFPILLAVGLGIAFRVKPPEQAHVALEVKDTAQLTPGAAKLKAALEASKDLQVQVLDVASAADQLKRNKVVLVISATNTTSTTPSISYRYDPTQPEAITAKLLADSALENAFGRRDMLAKRDDVLAEPGERYIDFLIPGLIGMNLMGSSMWGIGYAVVVTRSRKLMKRFAATPMRRSHYLLSFMFSRFLFLALEVLVLAAFGVLAFDVKVQGSVFAVAVLSTLGALSFAGIALLIAARPQSVEAANGWMNFAMRPMWFLSGSFFSYERFPELVQPILRALPLTALNDALRAVINDGRSLTEIWLEVVVLGLWGVVSFALALRLFRWQ